MGIGPRIKQAREMKRWTQADLAAQIGVTPSAIANYEKGTSHPKEQVLYALFDALGVDANFLFQDAMNTKPFDLDADESLLIEKFRQLDGFDRQTLLMMIDRFLDREPAGLTIAEEPVHYRPLTFYAGRPSAGSGNYLPDAMSLYHSEIQVPDTPETKKADFVLEVDGRSMEPRLLDGDRILVHRQDTVELGEIGVFLVNDEVVVKQCQDGYLHSLNPAYPDIQIRENDTVTCFGKVIGKL